MRFKKLSFVFAFAALLLSSCDFNEPKITKFNLSSKYYEEAGYIEIETKESFESLLTNKESFIIYQYLESCMGCYFFTPVLTEFSETNTITILKITADLGYETKLKDYASVSPTVFLFEKGTYKTMLDPRKEEHTSAFNKSEVLTEWFLTYVNLPPITN